MDVGLSVRQAVSTGIDCQRQLTPQNCLQVLTRMDTVDVLLEFRHFRRDGYALAKFLVRYLKAEGDVIVVDAVDLGSSPCM